MTASYTLNYLKGCKALAGSRWRRAYKVTAATGETLFTLMEKFIMEDPVYNESEGTGE